MFPSTQHTSFEFTATCFDLTSHLQAYLWTLTSHNLPVRVWDPRWLTCVFAYNVISMYYCIYVCIGGWRAHSWFLCTTVSICVLGGDEHTRDFYVLLYLCVYWGVTSTLVTPQYTHRYSSTLVTPQYTHRYSSTLVTPQYTHRYSST